VSIVGGSPMSPGERATLHPWRPPRWPCAPRRPGWLLVWLDWVLLRPDLHAPGCRWARIWRKVIRR
jgi:hypothetical protein